MTPTSEAARAARFVAAMVVMGAGIALTVEADLGLGPWDVLHQGLSNLTGVPIGTTGIVVGIVVLASWLPLGVRLRPGTMVNIVTIGTSTDVAIALFPTPGPLLWRVTALTVGTVALGLGAGLYIGCHLGTGPRDGVMTGLAARGWSVRAVRTVMEITVLMAGWALGGTVGVGTVVVALSLGPIIQLALDRWSYPVPSAARSVAVAQ